MRLFYNIIFLVFIAVRSLGQTDSLIKAYYATKADTQKIYLIKDIVYAYEQRNIDSAKIWAKIGFQLSTKTQNFRGLAQYYNHRGRLCYYVQKHDSAIYFYNKAYANFEKCGYVKGMVSCNNNIGALYAENGDYDKALSYHFKNVETEIKYNEKESLANSYINIANVYNQNGSFNLAVKFALKSIPLYEELKSYKSLGISYYNLANSNYALKNYKDALKYCKISEEYLIKGNAQNALINNYSIYAGVYLETNKLDQAISESHKVISLARQTNNSYTLFYSLNHLVNAFTKQNNSDSALFYAEEMEKTTTILNFDVFKAKAHFAKARALFDLGKYKESIVLLDSVNLILKTYKDKSIEADAKYYMGKARYALGEYKVAYEHIFANLELKERLYFETNSKNIFELQTLYETDKKEAQIKSQSFEIQSQEKENKQKTLVILFGTLALLGTGFFALIAFINYRKTKKQNIIIDSQKQQVEFKNEEITHQKELVEEKQKEIIDSINYAKRIQQAVLTGEDVWNKISKEHFILFKPKDIVSGDFYWAYNTPNNRSVFALADCTGHGVPGGFMSMLGNSFLNEIVVENKIFKADQILNKLRAKIIHALEQKGSAEQKDGMDISLCVWNKLDNTLEFSGANNPLWLLREKELLEYKADKMPIGLYLDEEKPFSSITIQLQKGDIIYLATDGYADQFGGPKGKKLKYKPLMQNLIRISSLDMITQKADLESSFTDWKATHDQVDDVSIIGIRI